MRTYILTYTKFCNSDIYRVWKNNKCVRCFVDEYEEPNTELTPILYDLYYTRSGVSILLETDNFTEIEDRIRVELMLKQL